MRGIPASNGAQEILRTREKDRARSLEEALARIIKTEDGRLVLRWMLSASMAGLTSAVFSESPTLHAYREGRRSVGVDLVAALEHVIAGAYADLMVDDRVTALNDRKLLESARSIAERDDDDE